MYYRPSFSEAHYQSVFDEVLIQKNDHEVVSFIQNIDPKVFDVHSMRNTIYINHEDFNERIPINTMGDGFRKMFGIIIGLVGM